MGGKKVKKAYTILKVHIIGDKDLKVNKEPFIIPA